MAIFTTPFSPMHIDCMVGQPFGNPDSSYTCGFHTGVDFPEGGTSETNPDLYSVSPDGVVVYTYKESQGTTPSLGNQVQILDNRTGLYFRYCHMLYGSITVNEGDRVNLNTKIGKMGNTGNSTGTHLHLEASSSQAWICENFRDPCQPLGFENVRGTVVKWSGSPTPPTPTPTNNTNAKKWAFSKMKNIRIKFFKEVIINEKRRNGNFNKWNSRKNWKRSFCFNCRRYWKINYRQFINEFANETKRRTNFQT